jgi:transcriptional regulator GlxA family with amidase domain
MARTRSVGILIFPDVEVLDFCGPFEVFSVAGHQVTPGSFNVFTVAAQPGMLHARNGLKVTPDFSFDDCPQIDLLLVPGGQGTRPLLKDEALLGWINTRSEHAELVLSVCTGSLLLGKCGLLDGLASTTHHRLFDLLAQVAPKTDVRRNQRVVDNGRVITSAGVSAGIDMSFHVVARLLGEEIAAKTAEFIEYPWQPRPAKS